MIEFAVLGSGSSGNSAVVCYGETRVLVDAGLSAKQLRVRLEEVGVSPDSLSAIVLTHEHGDHVQGLEVLCRKLQVPVYGTVHTCHVVQQDRIEKSEIAWKQFEAGSTFAIGDLQVETFNVPHDAVDPVGYVFRSPHGSVGVLSDVGHVTRLIVERLRGVDALFVESNYDDVMLQNDEKRPWSLKQRISNRHGHLSNQQTADLLKEIASPDLNRVVLGHLSSDCNTAEKALAHARSALEELGLGDVPVDCAERKNPTALFPATRKSLDPEIPLEKVLSEAAASIEEELIKTAPQSSEPVELIEAKDGRVREKSVSYGSPRPKAKTTPPLPPEDFVQMELAL